MKRFLLLSSLVVIAVVSTLLLGEWCVRQVPNAYRYKHQWMLQHADEVDMLFLGSSHIYAAVDPACVNVPSFNLANSSQNFKYDYYLLQNYASRYKQLKTVVLPISYFSFFDAGYEESKEWWYAINYKIYMDCPYHSDFSKYNMELFHPSVYVGKLKSYLLNQNRILCDSLGRGTQYTLDTKEREWETISTINTVAIHTAKDWSHISSNMEDLKKIISFCKSRSISLVLLTTPTWHAYYDRLDNKQLEKMYNLILEIQATDDLPYYDYLKDPRFVADDFYNSDHLSDKGAKKFTDILISDFMH